MKKTKSFKTQFRSLNDHFHINPMIPLFFPVCTNKIKIVRNIYIPRALEYNRNQEIYRAHSHSIQVKMCKFNRTDEKKSKTKQKQITGKPRTSMAAALR